MQNSIYIQREKRNKLKMDLRCGGGVKLSMKLFFILLVDINESEKKIIWSIIKWEIP